MNKYLPYFKIILLVIVPVVVVISVLLLIINKGFYYSDFRNRIEVSISSESQEELSKAVDTMKGLPGLAIYNSETITFYFQNVSLDTIVNGVSGIETESLNVNVKEVIVNNRYILQNYIWFLVIVTLVTSGTTFYIVLKEKGRINLKEVLKFYSPFVVSIIMTSIIFLGALSFVSRFKYLTEFEFLPIFFINLLIAILFFLSVYKLDYKEEFTFVSFTKRLFKTTKDYSMSFLIVFSVSMVAILVVFGIETLPFVISFLIALFIIYLIAMWLYLFSLARIKSFKVRKIKKKQTVTLDTTKSIGTKKKKKKSKKKKK